MTKRALPIVIVLMTLSALLAGCASPETASANRSRKMKFRPLQTGSYLPRRVPDASDQRPERRDEDLVLRGGFR